ncbi:MJ0042-type zinc finger domain-containing protein [Rosistilla oblonga]|uniref:MJ0042-type zinc finger domain-containing protein n=1 Tax=Rosistilla oblonga TaxID=2527990 RepID=UPI003A97A6F1
MSVLQIRCPGCQAVLRIPATAAGSKVRCSQCKKVLAIPARSPAAADKKSDSQNPAATARAPTAAAATKNDDPFAGLDDSGGGDPFGASTPYSPPSSTPATAASFQPSFSKQPAEPTPVNSAGRPKWLVPAIVGGLLAGAAMIVVTGLGYVAFNRSVKVAGAQQREANAEAKAAATATALRELDAVARDNPIPDTWQRQGTRGVSVLMPAEASIREVASPIQGQLVFRVDGTDPETGGEFWLTEMPVPSGTEVRRDMWLRNLYRYSGATAEEQLDVTRSGVVGKRILLARDGEQTDPVMEVFELSDRLVIISVQPATTALAEAFFASLTLPSGSDKSDGVPAEQGIAAAPASANPSDVSSTPPQLTGDEARRQKLYLEYRRFAGANNSRSPLPGINARDAVDSLLGKVSESQTQAFLVLHGLTEKQLGEIISEGNSKNWADR